MDNKPKRKRISPDQFCLLSELFEQTDTPSHELRERLAKKLEMTNREVQVFFFCIVFNNKEPCDVYCVT